MIASSLLLGLLGLGATFAPDAVLIHVRAPLSPPLVVIVQLLGALYLGFAMLNWMARGNVMGGIYSRPVAIGNLVHFLIAALALVKLLPRHADLWPLWATTVIYAAFAVGFAAVVFGSPAAQRHR